MPPGSTWLRARMARAVGQRLAAVALVATVVAHSLLLWRTAQSGWWLLAWSILAGQVVVALSVVAAVTANPLGYRFLRRYLEGPTELVPVSLEGECHEHAEPFLTHGFSLAATVRDGVDEDPAVFDLLQSANGRMVAGVSRTTGDLTVLSALTDGRLLHTSAFLVPPHRHLVVNTAPTLEPIAVLGSHTQALAALDAHGIRPTVTTARAFRDAARSEREAYAALGPVLGAFYDPVPGRVSPATVRVDPAEVLERSLR